MEFISRASSSVVHDCNGVLSSANDANGNGTYALARREDGRRMSISAASASATAVTATAGARATMMAARAVA